MIGIGIGIPHKKGIQRLKYLLDEDFAQGATTAYSLGLLREEHSGSAVRIRRDIDNTEKDIGFIGKNFDTQTAENFATGNDLTKAGDYGSGAEAIYSLRYATDNYSGSVVRARRDIDNAEQDFTPTEITDGTLTDFAKGNNLTKAGDYGAGAAAIYSLRYATDNYSGPVIRVREDSGNTEQDFTPTEITDGTLASFVGSNNGYVSKWYDQSGNGNDAENSSASEQPKIYDSTNGLIKQNGKPTLEFDGSDDYLDVGTGVYSVSESVVNHFAVAYLGSNLGDNSYLIGTKVVDNGYLQLYDDSNGRFRIATQRNSLNVDNGSTVTNTQHLVYMYADRASLEGYLDGSSDINIADDNSNFAGNHMIIGAKSVNPKGNFKGNCQEIVIYTDDQSSNRTDIEAEITSHYKIYSNNNAFVSTWYDQSGNGNDVEQLNASNQPQIVNSGSLIIENGNPAVNFDGSGDYLNKDFSSTLSQPNTVFAVSSFSDLTTNRTIFDGDSSNRHQIYYGSSANAWQSYAGQVAKRGTPNTNQHLFSVFFNTTNSSFYLDGSSLITGKNLGSQDLGMITLGAALGNSPTSYLQGNIQELVLYSDDQSSNRTDIEAEITSHYKIYTNNDAFVTKWYDQSGNGNDASNSTASEQPQIVSGGSVIQSNNEPALNFNGSSHFLQANGGLDSTKDFSVLVRLESEKDKFERIINTNDDTNGFRLRGRSDDVRVSVEDSTIFSNTIYSPKPLNTSVLISITHDGDLRVFENNTEKTNSKNHQFSGSDPVGPTIGAKGYVKSEFFNGKMNTVLFYDRSVDNEINKFNKNI